LTRINSAIAQRSSVRPERAIALLDRGEPFGVLPGTPQSFCHLERHEPGDDGPGLAEFVAAGAQQP
jgi:hypothetical protein